MEIFILTRKNHQAKINDFKDVIKTNLEYARAHNYLGLTYLEQKNYSAAKNSLLESIRVNPKYAKANNNLGVLYEEMGNTAKAIESYRLAQRIDPNDPDSFYNLGLIYDSLKDGDNSVRHMVLAKKAHEKKYGQKAIESISEKLDQLKEKYTVNKEVESVASQHLSSEDEDKSPAKMDINQVSIVSSVVPSLNPSKTPNSKSPGISHQTSSILTVNLKPQLDLSSAPVASAMKNQIEKKVSTTENTIERHHNQEKTDPNAIINIQNELIADAGIKENNSIDPKANPIPTNLSLESEKETDVTPSPSSNPEKKGDGHKKEKKTWASDWVFEYPK